MLEKLFIPMLCSFLISVLFTPVVIKIAHHVKAIDVPKDERRIHNIPVPLLGGLSLYIATIICMVVFVNLESSKLVGIVVGSSLIVFMGFIDDINPIPAKYKFLVQIVAAFILVFSGIRITGLSSILNMQNTIVVDEFLGVVLSVIWIVGITNTLNLIDGLDGLTSGVATISSFTLAYVSFTNGRIETAIITLIIAGACLGFLPYNFNPAQIFMGDTGALFLGFILSAISIEGTIKSATAITFFAPVLALGIPVLDTAMAIVRRLLKGQNPFSADKEHLHHKILSTGIGQKRTVLFLYFINTMFGIAGVFLLNRNYLEMSILILFTFSLLVYFVKEGKKLSISKDNSEKKNNLSSFKRKTMLESSKNKEEENI